MSAGANFFVCSCAILALAIVELNIGVCVSRYEKDDMIDVIPAANCGRITAIIEEYKKKNKPQNQIEEVEKIVPMCRNIKAMYALEHISLILNAAIGFIGILLGLYGLQNGIMPKTGLIGMALGVFGFILSFLYVIFNGIVYTNYYEDNTYKVDRDSAFAELNGPDTYKCLYFNKVNDTDALIAKFSDLIKSQYNYNNDLYESFKSENNPERSECNVYSDKSYIRNCDKEQTFTPRRPMTYTDKKGKEQTCEKLYYYSKIEDYSNYDKSARMLSCLILSLFTVLCYCGLAFSGFIISKESKV